MHLFAELVGEDGQAGQEGEAADGAVPDHLEVVEAGMRRSPGSSCSRGCHDDVMIYRGGSSVSRVRAVVLSELVMYLRSVLQRLRESTVHV